MNKLELIILNFTYFAIILEIIIAIIFFNINAARLIFVNNVSVLIMATQPFLEYNFHLKHPLFYYITVTALYSYPVTYSMLMKSQYFIQKSNNLIFASIISILGIILHFIFIEQSSYVIFVIYFIFSLSILFNIFKHKTLLTKILFSCFVLAYTLYLFYSINMPNFENYVITCFLMNLITFCIIIFNFKGRVDDFVVQVENLKFFNKKLSHTVTRLRHSSEQSRKIIIEKDLEIYQLSRHASLAELSTGIAHELSQPLTGIKGIAQNMIDDINYQEFDKEQSVHELNRIAQLVDKSSSIIDHIRRFTKKNVFVMKPVDLNQAVLDSIELIKIQTSKSDIDLVLELDENIPKINGDKISLEQLTVNMIINSKDAILAKKPKDDDYSGTIRIITIYDNRNVILKIEDNGIGISDAIIQKIWSPFFTTKNRSHGTGVGLSISKKIIKEHNARVEVESNSNGTVFVIYFPALDVK